MRSILGKLEILGKITSRNSGGSGIRTPAGKAKPLERHRFVWVGGDGDGGSFKSRSISRRTEEPKTRQVVKTCVLSVLFFRLDGFRANIRCKKA